MKQDTIPEQPESFGNCLDCNKPVTKPPFGSHRFTYCDVCIEKMNKERERLRAEQEAKEERAKQSRELSRWIPALYRDSERSKIKAKNPKILPYLDSYDIENDPGLYFSGTPGSCKTRVACMILERYCRAGWSIAMIQAEELAALARSQFKDDEYEGDQSALGGFRGKSSGEKSRQLMKEIKTAGVLLIDDVGKAASTPRSETELFSLLEYRTSSLKPTLYTSNFPPVELIRHFSQDQGEAIVRRIVEFSVCFEV